SLMVSFVVVAIVATATMAAKSPVQERRVVDQRVVNSTEYAFPDKHIFTGGTAPKDSRPDQSLGGVAPTQSPGKIIGSTWLDMQHIGSMGRMIETRTDASNNTIVHIGWTYLWNSALVNSQYVAYGYNLTDQYFGNYGYPSDDLYPTGYVGISSTSDNRTIIGGQNVEPSDGFIDSHFYWDIIPLSGLFYNDDKVPRAFEEYIWPKFRWVEPPASDPILHVIAQTSEDVGDPQAIIYFRRVGTDSDPAAYWDAVATMVMDTVFDPSHDIAATDDGRVALVWTANLPCSPGGPSSTGDCDPPRYVQWDNDVWYMVSENYGSVGSWSAKTNITNYAATEGQQDSYRPYTDLSALMDNDDGELHIVWAAAAWAADIYDGGSQSIGPGRLFHWSEDCPYLRVVHAFDWEQTTCHAGAWNITASKLTISQCRGMHYVLFTQFNDIPGGIENDCADESSPGYPYGAANGDLWIVVSANGGITWDKARNITQSPSPGCDPDMAYPCENDHWASMSRYGTNIGNESDPNQAMLYPGGDMTSHDGYYLDIMWIHDHSAGSIIQGEGTWQNADVMWGRLACVEPAPAPIIMIRPIIGVDWPEWTKHGCQYDVDITLENLGNANLTFSAINIIKYTELGTDWLDHDLPLTDLPPGLNNTRDGHIYINKGGVINSPGTVVLLEGAIEFVTNAPSSPDLFPISLIVADTVSIPDIDTINTTCLSLAVANNLEMGNSGADGLGMGYSYPVDECDSTATTYMYSGSPVIGYKTGEHAKMNWSIYGTDYSDTSGFVQISDYDPIWIDNYITYEAKALALDSGIIFEKKWYAPQDVEDCNFIIERLRVYDNLDKDGANDHYGLVIGEVIDWDIPSDTVFRNGSDFDENLMAIWQTGAYYDDGEPGPCTPDENDSRYAGMNFLTMYKDDGNTLTRVTDGEGCPFHNAYTVDNATYVFSNYNNGFNSDTLYELMTENTGYSIYSSAEPESTYVDLHTTMSFVHNYDLLCGDTFVVWLAIWSLPIGSDVADVTDVVNASRDNWCEDFLPEGYEPVPNVCGCCVIRGDVDHNGSVDIADLTYKVAYLFLGGPPPPCLEEMDDNGDGQYNIADLTYEVEFFFLGGPPPVPCP
ncbi:MAG: hypothetical protein DRP47_03425, partial [Candidatus Zixiibacteriota bacterium]